MPLADGPTRAERFVQIEGGLAIRLRPDEMQRGEVIVDRRELHWLATALAAVLARQAQHQG